MTTFLLAVVHPLVIHENIVFYKQNEVSITRSDWLLTFVIDLRPYENFIDKLSLDVHRASHIAEGLVDIYQEPKRCGFLNAFKNLQTEISELITARNSILFSYGDIRTLNPSRDKRSLIPFVGKALHFLFGTMTESDFSKVRKNVATLSANQKEIVHILEDSISILNTSQVQIAENRDNINELTETLLQLDGRLDNLTRTLENQVVKLKEFVQIYLQLDLIIEQVK